MSAHTTTQDVCTSSDRDMRAMLQQQQGCTVSDYRQIGDVVSDHPVCGGNPPKMTGEARFEMIGVCRSCRRRSGVGGIVAVNSGSFATRSEGGKAPPFASRHTDIDGKRWPWPGAAATHGR